MDQPLISVVIPVRDGERFLASAMESIVAQEYHNLEVLLVDDGSTDGLAGCAKEWAALVRYIRQPQQGQAAARNRGVRESKGELIAFLDIDDLWTPGHLTRLRHCLEQNPDAAIAQGFMRQFWTAPDGSRQSTAPYRMPYLGSCLFRRRVFDQCGLFDERMPHGEDYDFLFRCWEHDVVKVVVPEVSLFYRRHPCNMTRGRNTAAHMVVLKRRIERIRAGVADPAAPRRFVFQQYMGDQEQLTDLSLGEVSECDLRLA